MDINNINELKAQLEQLKSENAALKTNIRSKLTLRITEKGAVGLYGLRKFPVVLYAEEWLKVFGTIEAVKSFIETNKATLSFKNSNQG